jgi:hypothetical protein
MAKTYLNLEIGAAEFGPNSERSDRVAPRAVIGQMLADRPLATYPAMSSPFRQSRKRRLTQASAGHLAP